LQKFKKGDVILMHDSSALSIDVLEKYWFILIKIILKQLH